MTEEERAALWRLQQRNREKNRRMVNRLLAGNKQKAKNFKTAWAPLTKKTL